MGYDMTTEQGGDYFRLSVWGMGPIRDAMAECGMLDWNVRPVDPTDWQNEAQLHLWQSAVPEGTKGIAGYKLCSNDGWLVTPSECEAAVAAWDKEVESRGDEPFSEVDMWDRWVNYLRRAAKQGGFRVW